MSDSQFVDPESYSSSFSNKDQLSFKLIVLQHLQKIGHYASVEFRGGYWEERADPRPNSNMTTKIYIPDTREVYSNSIDYLYDILYPYFDSQMKEAGKETEKALIKAYNDNTILKEKSREEEKYLEEDPKREFKDITQRVNYRIVRQKLNRNLFRNLCSFLYRKKYLELGKIED